MSQSISRDELIALIDQAAAEGWTELDLSGKGLTELPPEIGKLTQLETLLLGKQDFEQKGPEGEAGWKQENGKWVAITVGNSLTRLPEAIKGLSNLKTLDLSGNLWDSFSDSLLALDSLETLKVISCDVTEIPETIAQLSNLTELYLSSNQITEIPEEITQLSNLTELYISSRKKSQRREENCPG